MPERTLIASHTTTVPMGHTAVCDVFALPVGFEVTITVAVSEDKPPAFTRRYRSPDLDQLCKFALAEEAASLSSTNSWRQSVMDTIREAIYAAQDARYDKADAAR